MIATVPDHSGLRSGYLRRSRTIQTRQTICRVSDGSVVALNQDDRRLLMGYGKGYGKKPMAKKAKKKKPVKKGAK